MSDYYTICGLRNAGMIYVYGERPENVLLKTIDLRKYFEVNPFNIERDREQGKDYPYIEGVTVISENFMMVVCWLGIVFISLPSGQIVACLKLGDEQCIYSGTILQDGRIYAAGSSGHCATFQAPDIIRDDVKRFAVSSRRASSSDGDAANITRFRNRGLERRWACSVRLEATNLYRTIGSMRLSCT